MDHRPILELFASELRRARTNAGLTQDGLAQEINFSASLVAAVEQCRRVPKPEFTGRCDARLATDGLLERIREVASREVLLPWFREWVKIEQQATALRSYEPLVIPGLLQTEAYARALLTGASRFGLDEIVQQVAARMERQAVLTKERPPRLVAVLDEYVLRRPVGGPEVMREQLLHLVEVGQRYHVHLHVVPASVGAYAGLNGAFVLATPEDGDDVGYLDNQLQGHIVEMPSDVLSLRDTWESVRAEALSHGQTIEMITEVARTWS
ncbi:helix-turn-helix transcriptional regulator [Micromonospora sp. NPDC049559]|uniref:helix-turn-helix domain-containing protein n=1 Tax=Micromonospora sp. NPDC049559 TaxID=3155923 RepID=UPI003432130F